MIPYTVIGYWKDDTHEPSTIHVEALDPSEAAQIAAFKAMDWIDKDGKIELFEIVQVIEGHHKGLLGDDVTLEADYVANRFFDTHDRSVLPTYIGITPSLDRAIERRLKR